MSHAALVEIRRVLKPGGRLHFLEHGLAPDAKVQRMQHRMDPIQRRVAGGCTFSRPIVDLVRGAGFHGAGRGRHLLPAARAEVRGVDLARIAASA